MSGQLRNAGYAWTADPGLRVYEQQAPNVATRTTTFRYNQKVWETSEYTDGKNWFNRQTGTQYQLRFDPYNDADNVNRMFPDNDVAGISRTLREIAYVIYKDGNRIESGWSGSKMDDFFSQDMTFHKKMACRNPSAGHFYGRHECHPTLYETANHLPRRRF